LSADDERLVEMAPPDFSVKKAREIQLKVSKRIVMEDRLPPDVKMVAGIDASYGWGSAVASAVVLDYDTLEVIEVKYGRVKERFPYVPTLLMFREAPALFKAMSKLRSKPDVYLIDAHGLAHPYRCGLASYVGVIKNVPTIGVAKRLLCGKVGGRTGDLAPIIDGGETVGAELTTGPGRRPVYISIGNMVSLGRAIEVVRHCMEGHRMPEPLRVAHEEATREKLRMIRGLKT